MDWDELQIDWTALRLTEPTGKEQEYCGVRFIHYPKSKSAAQQIVVLNHRRPIKLLRLADGAWANRSVRV
mgnify:CR=1 FL=1